MFLTIHKIHCKILTELNQAELLDSNLTESEIQEKEEQIQDSMYRKNKLIYYVIRNLEE